MSNSMLSTILWALSIILWLGALISTVLASDGNPTTGAVFIFTRPVVTAIAATLSLGLIARRLVGSSAKVAAVWTIAYAHGAKDERERP